MGVRGILATVVMAMAIMGSSGRHLQQANPFLVPSSSSSPAPSPARSPAARSPSLPPAQVVEAAPAPEGEAQVLSPAVAARAPAAGGAVPSGEAQTGEGGPCSCSEDGISGGANTTVRGCGQWDVISGSNQFTCYVEVRSGNRMRLAVRRIGGEASAKGISRGCGPWGPHLSPSPPPNPRRAGPDWLHD